MPQYDHFDEFDAEALNPYQAPGAGIGRSPSDTQSLVWAEWDLLVMIEGAALPDRCCKCNRPTSGPPLKRTLVWHPPGWYALLCLYLFVYLIAYFLVRRTMTVYVGLCEEHRRRRTRDCWIAWLASLTGIAFLIVSMCYESSRASPFVLLGFVFMVGGIIYGRSTVRTITAKKIVHDKAWITGFCAEYLDSLEQADPKGSIKIPDLDIIDL